MHNANFAVEFLGWPQEGQLGVFMVGTCDVADDGMTWHLIFQATGPPVSPWPNPQEAHGPGSGVKTELTLFSQGGTVSYSWNTLQVNVWRDATGKPLRVYCEGDGNLGIEFDTGYPGLPANETMHRKENGKYVGDLAFTAQSGIIE